MEPEERLFLGLKLFERLKPQPRQGRLSSQAKNAGAFSLPSLPALLDSAGALPDYSAVLGACEDGLPFILDLANPAPGALLVAADAGAGKSRLVRAFLASINRLNAPEQVQFQILAADPQEYRELEDDAHCIELRSVHGSPADPIDSLSMTVERRRYRGIYGALIVFIIDDLAACLQRLDPVAIEQLAWLARHGARSGVWVLATLRPDDLGELDDRILSSFRTCLLGQISSPMLAQRLAGGRTTPRGLDALEGEFCVPFGDNWVHFWICDDDHDSPNRASEEV